MSGVVGVEDGERYLLKHLGRDCAIEYVNRVLRGTVDPCGGRDKLWWRCVRASLLNPRGAHMPNPTPPDRVREARGEMRAQALEARAGLLKAIIVLQTCGKPYLSTPDEDAAVLDALDAYAAAIRAECAAEIAALKADRERLDLVQRAGERRQVWLECDHLNPNSVAAQEEGAYRWTLFGQGLGDMGRGRTARDAIDAARAEGK